MPTATAFSRWWSSWRRTWPATPPSEQAIAESILAQLLRLNSEFANYVPAEYQLPRVRLAPLGDPDYFPVGVKHRYTRKPAE